MALEMPQSQWALLLLSALPVNWLVLGEPKSFLFSDGQLLFWERKKLLGHYIAIRYQIMMLKFYGTVFHPGCSAPHPHTNCPFNPWPPSLASRSVSQKHFLWRWEAQISQSLSRNLSWSQWWDIICEIEWVKVIEEEFMKTPWISLTTKHCMSC